MIPFDLHYLIPQAGYLLPLVLLWLILFAITYWRRQTLLESLGSMSIRRTTFLFSSKALLFAAAWSLALIALMQPVGNGHYPEGKAPHPEKGHVSFKRKAHDVILLLDASASMAVTDTREGKSRLSYAKEVAAELLAKFNGENAALYAFTSQIDKISPLTMDYLFIRMMLADVAINEGGSGGTNLVEAVSAMRQRYFAKPAPLMKTLIVLSDGGDTAIESLQGSGRTQAIDSLAALVNNSEQLQLRVFTIGFGSARGGIVPGVTNQGQPVQAVLQENVLRALSQRGRGAYYSSNDMSAIALADDLYKRINQDPQYYDENQKLTNNSLLQNLIRSSALIYDPFYQWPLALALALLMFAIGLPDTWERALQKTARS